MNKGLAIGLGVAGVAVVGDVGYLLLARRGVSPAAAASAAPGPRLTTTAPGARLAPPPPPGVPGVISNYTRPDGGLLYWDERTQTLFTQTGVPYPTGPSTPVIMKSYADGSPADLRVYLKGGVPYLLNGVRVINSSMIDVRYLATPPAPTPSSSTLSPEELARRAAEAAKEELRRKAEQAAKSTLDSLLGKGGDGGGDGGGGGGSLTADVAAKFGVSGRWSGRDAHQMTNHPMLGVHTKVRR